MISLPRFDFPAVMQWSLAAPPVVRIIGTIAMVTLNLLFTTALTLLSIRGNSWYGLLYPSVLLSALLFDRFGGILAVFTAMWLDWAVATFVLDKIGIPHPTVFGVTAVIFVGFGVFMSLALGALHKTYRRYLANFDFLSESNAELRWLNNKLTEDERFTMEMLNESKHRIRNDLQRLSSTVSLQIMASKHRETKEALTSVQQRLTALGSIKARLDASTTQRGGKALVDIQGFLSGLCEDWIRMNDGIAGTLDMHAEPHDIPEARATLLGLIANEWVTNALKYAFVEKQGGTISVRFEAIDDKTFGMQVYDDGDGIDPNAQPKGSGLGTKLVRAMASQLRGTVTVVPRRGGGTICSITLPIETD